MTSGRRWSSGPGRSGAARGRLAGLGLPVRAVSRHRQAGLPEGIDWRGADPTDPGCGQCRRRGRRGDLAECLNAPYTRWPELFPPLQQGALAAAEHAGAILVSLENVYGYGPTGGKPMTEDLPLAATTVKGRARAAMTQGLLAAAEAGRVRIAIGRAADFFGPGVTDAISLGERFFGRPWRAGALTSSATLTAAHLQLRSGYRGRAGHSRHRRARDGQIWHLPGPKRSAPGRYSISSPRIPGIRSASARCTGSPCAPSE